jgi:DNA-binding GntR family transcriptional regulator
MEPSKTSHILRQLRADIVSGVWAPGQKISFRLLTAHYDASLSPLREALCQLVGHGLVTLESQRGFRVAPASRADLLDTIAMRELVEVYAFGLSIERGDAAWRAALRAARERFARVAAKVGDPRPICEAWEEAHRGFHFALIGACGSPGLLAFCERIYDRFDRYRRIAIPRQSFMANVARDHDELTTAALAGAKTEAQSLLRQHLAQIAEVVSENFAAPDAG